MLPLRLITKQAAVISPSVNHIAIYQKSLLQVICAIICQVGLSAAGSSKS